MNRTASALLHAGFVLTGVVTTMLGPLLPWLMLRWGLNDSQAGYLFTAQFIGSMAGVALSGFMVRRLRFRFALVFGYATLAVGVASLAVACWPFALAPVFTFGMGLGVAIPATNLCVSDANPNRRASALNVVNLAWGIGAVLCPALISAFQHSMRPAYVLPAIASTLLGLTVALALSGSSPWESTSSHLKHTDALTSAAPEPAVTAAKPPAAAAATLAALFYLYVGTESSLSGWIAAYASRISVNQGSGWLWAPAFFWAALLLGRAISPVALRYVADMKLAACALMLAATGTTVLIAADNVPAILLAAALSGLGLASVYPITIALLSHWFGQFASRVAPFMFALASMGGATLPWVVGRLSSQTGTLRSGLTLPLVTTILMLTLYVFAIKKRFRPLPEHKPESHAIHA